MAYHVYNSLGTLRTINRYVIIECDKELGAYYRRLVRCGLGWAHEVHKPMWGYHISIVVSKYETIPDNFVDLSLQYEGLSVEYWYANAVQTDGTFFWLPVCCPPILDLREKLGLRRQTHYPLHLTFGNIK